MFVVSLTGSRIWFYRYIFDVCTHTWSHSMHFHLIIPCTKEAYLILSDFEIPVGVTNKLILFHELNLAGLSNAIGLDVVGFFTPFAKPPGRLVLLHFVKQFQLPV